jgi:hypothetical protein
MANAKPVWLLSTRRKIPPRLEEKIPLAPGCVSTLSSPPTLPTPLFFGNNLRGLSDLPFIIGVSLSLEVTSGFFKLMA